MVESVTNVFLETLRDLVVEETKFLLGVSDEVEQVHSDLRSIHALLMKIDRDRRDSPTLKDYVTQLKELACKAENVLETYAVKVAFNKEGRSLKKKLQRYICIMCECNNVHHVGKDTQHIISRLADLSNKLQSEFGRQESSSHSNPQEYLLRQTYGHEVEHHFVGMEKDIENLVSMVKDETRVVKIYGMGGLGKTTLARKIYNHPDVQSYARAWVCITQQFQHKAILSKILKQLDSSAHNDSMEVSELMEGIYRFLEQRKCLIVIDDIWENDHWEIIKPAFPMNCNVLLTTRSENIANQECHSYKLRCLTEDEGWDLLQKIALPQDIDPVETGLKSLEAIGRQIVVKCGHLPLSISVIGGILGKKEEDTLAEWKKVNMNMDSYLLHGEGVTQYTKVKQVLDLSYDVLPYHLKPCFLYLALFPEDEEIDTERLYLLWMAEGFISYQDKGPNETLRDVAQRYLTELAMRCMVQVQKGDKFFSCRLHDLMHDLCSSKVEQENLLKRIEISSIDTSTNRLAIPSSIGNSISRLAITNHVYTDKFSIDGLEKIKDLRSLIFRGNGIRFEGSTVNVERSGCLRILVLDGCEFEGGKLPRKLGKLIHLRYLSLRYSRMGELPQFVCGMPYLQTLDLRVSYTINRIRLPNVIWKMKRLKHLFLPYKKIEVIGGEKLRLDGLEELETLQCINSETARIADIPKLINLRELHVTVSDMESLSTVSDHTNSRYSCEIYLHVESCDLSSEIGKDVFRSLLMSPLLVSLRISECNIGGGFTYDKQGMCENLLNLEVRDCKVDGDVMEELGKYPMLQSLWLEGEEIGKTETICRSKSFPQLKSLVLELPRLKKWEVEERAMPKLTDLWIENCRNLEKVPDGLIFASTLRKLYIRNMPKEFNERVRGQDYATILCTIF